MLAYQFVTRRRNDEPMQSKNNNNFKTAKVSRSNYSKLGLAVPKQHNAMLKERKECSVGRRPFYAIEESKGWMSGWFRRK